MPDSRRFTDRHSQSAAGLPVAVPVPAVTDPRAADTAEDAAAPTGAKVRVGGSADLPASYYWLAFAACATGALACVWSGKYLPMVDLPQHTAQIALWKLLGHADYAYRDRFELNWLTPYLFTVLTGRAFATVMTTAAAVKCVLSLAILGLPLAMQRLLDETGGDRWWALLGFPLAFGHGFVWGLLPHLVAIPFGIALVAEGFGYASSPSRAGIARMGALAFLLLLTHVLVLVLCALVAIPVVAGLASSRRVVIAGCAPLAVAIVLAFLWFGGIRVGDATTPGSTVWNYGVFRRVIELPGALLGDLPALERFFSPDPQGEVFRTTALALLMGLLLPVVGGLRPGRSWANWAPCAGAGLFYLFAPLHPFGSHFVNTRYAVFLVPFALAAVRWPDSAVRRASARLLIVSFVLGWMLLLGGRFHAFDLEARRFDAVLESMEPNRTVLSLPFAATSAVLPGIPYLHFAAWYQVEKGGIVDVSFAGIAHHLIRYRETAMPHARSGFEFEPAAFDWKEHGGYDYFLVRSPTDLGPELFRNAVTPIFLQTRNGEWWLYGREQGNPASDVQIHPSISE